MQEIPPGTRTIHTLPEAHNSSHKPNTYTSSTTHINTHANHTKHTTTPHRLTSHSVHHIWLQPPHGGWSMSLARTTSPSSSQPNHDMHPAHTNAHTPTTKRPTGLNTPRSQNNTSNNSTIHPSQTSMTLSINSTTSY